MLVKLFQLEKKRCLGALAATERQYRPPYTWYISSRGPSFTRDGQPYNNEGATKFLESKDDYSSPHILIFPTLAILLGSGEE